MLLEPALSGPDTSALARALADQRLVPEKPPVDVGGSSATATANWPAALSDASEVILRWDDGTTLAVLGRDIVKLTYDGFEGGVTETLQSLSRLPFTIASFKTMYPTWRSEYGYRPPTFGDLHWRHGWACAFKGDGHGRLVSRRWLDFGPWRVLRGDDDTTLIQFHDLEADAETALEQARPGHERMGVSDSGGFIQSGYVYAQDLSGLYSPDERSLKVLVFDREISQRELLDAAAARYYQALGPDRPIGAVAYVFVEEEEARANLHELWLREFECWAFVDGVETRLDEGYEPKPDPPPWVRAHAG
jgi:hypothetical protein